MHRAVECVAANFFAYFKNRLRRARRDALDTIKQMKLPEDDDKREKEVVEKTLAQVCVCNIVFVVVPFDVLLPLTTHLLLMFLRST